MSSYSTTQRCLSRLTVPVEDIITSQALHLEKLNNWKDNLAITSGSISCPLNQSTSDPPPLQFVSNVCPYVRMEVVAPRSVRTSRTLRYILDPPVIKDSNLLHSMDDIFEYLRVVSEVFTTNYPPSPIDGNTFGSELPGEISLYRLQSYTFDIYLYMNEDQETGDCVVYDDKQQHF